MGYPYLVRLNPNIPWKTRGNGAVCIQLSPKKSTTSENSEPSEDRFNDYISRIEKIIQSEAKLDDENTNPGIVLSTEKLPIELYWSAVRGVVELDNIRNRLSDLDVRFKGFKKGRGIIGASAAIAWASNVNELNPINQNDSRATLDFTYELITYRFESRWGKPRDINIQAVAQLDFKFPSTFNNYDRELGHVSIAPNSPCPVLYGVRGDSASELREVLKFLKPKTEPVDNWQIFQTNQGTDDHLIQTRIPDIEPYTSVITSGMVTSEPTTITGGHVLFNLANNSSNKEKHSIAVAAYEPTKSFRNLIRALISGDEVCVYGGVRVQPRTINIEKLEITDLVSQKIKENNPKCPSCDRSMKSIGHDKGYRCKKCHNRVSEALAPYVQTKRKITTGIYEVPIAARRHLSKPLKRCNSGTG